MQLPLPKIRRVVIDKLRRIDHLELNLVGPDDKPVSQFIIAGPNGCGKTTVLEGILFGLRRYDLVLRDEPHSARWTPHINSKLATLGALVGEARVQVELESEGVRQVQSNLPDGVPYLTPQIEFFSSWRAPHLVGPLTPLPTAHAQDNEVNRLWRLKQRLIDEKSRRGFGGTAVRGAEWLDLLNQAWRRLHGPDGTSLDLQIVDDKAEDVFADLFVTKSGRRLCPIDQLSSGELELISTAGWLLVSGTRDGILLIDEPELHLHPQWQATFLPALHELAPDLQIIAASHADAPWEQAQPWERALIVDDSDPRSEKWAGTCSRRRSARP
jgi:ABC-type transport system involved in cytochrome c biogenesis ATPase subunit